MCVSWRPGGNPQIGFLRSVYRVFFPHTRNICPPLHIFSSRLPAAWRGPVNFLLRMRSHFALSRCGAFATAEKNTIVSKKNRFFRIDSCLLLACAARAGFVDPFRAECYTVSSFRRFRALFLPGLPPGIGETEHNRTLPSAAREPERTLTSCRTVGCG